MAKSSFIATAVEAVRAGPREIFNWHIIIYTCLWSFSGVSKGFDKGNIASLVSITVFKKTFDLDTQSTGDYANTKGWIVSIATGGTVFGCLFCVFLTERLGRPLAFQVLTLFYIAGVLGQTFSGGNLNGLYAARFIAGIGIGGTTILPPIYISKIAPRSIRGILTLQYAGCQQLGVLFGFFFNYGITKRYNGTNVQWQLPTALQIIPAVIWRIGTFFTPESPRYLLSRGKNAQALKVLSSLRRLPAQWSGANAITQYSPTIFGYLGIEGEETTLLATGIYGVVKFASTLLFSICVVDFIGRRRSLITGIILQITTLIVVGAYLGATTGRSVESISSDPSATTASRLAIVAIYLHAVAWSIGWFSIPYLVSSEVFPIRIRSLCVSFLMAVHWAFYFAVSRATPSLLVATNRYGAFAFFASICSVSLVYVFFAMPDTTGRSMESLDGLFERPWYTV
ncbi:general substrate transporter [Astrocystis sublimbata]|nr:general substrate transporter [Astrocystis sublimbata]KAI0203427.1 general substrate transporter [Astrocystis sublimbata]